jgi:DNA polymerase-1
MKNLIIDGNNLVHRTYWTAKTQLRDEGDEDKLNNYHVYFTLNAIKSYVNMYKPDSIFVCWDEKINYQPNERKKDFEEYKGNRSGDVSMHRNNDKIKTFLTALGIPSFFPQALEADDVIAYLCDTLEGQKIILSVDKDFLQLVSSSVIVYDPIRKKETNLANFTENVKCELHDFLIIKGLMGDKSDNVSGIPGYGKVKVSKFLKNEVKLTDEEYKVYQRNIELFRLTKYADKDMISEKEYYDQQLETSRTVLPNFKEFISLCEGSNISSILNKKEDWYGLFFVKHKLASLFK